MLKKIIFFTIVLFAGCSDWKDNPVINKEDISDQISGELTGWNRYNLPENTTSFFPYSKILAFAGNQDGKIYYSVDNCVTWIESSIDLQNSGKVQCLYNYYNTAQGYSGNYSIAATDKAIFLSTDNGRRWVTQIQYPSFPAAPEINCILVNKDVIASFQNMYVMGGFGESNTYYAALNTAKRSWYITKFNSVNATIASCCQIVQNNATYSIAFNSDGIGKVKSANNNYVIGEGIRVKIVTIDSRGFLFLGTDKGLYFSVGQSSWRLLAFENLEIMGLCANSNGCVFVATKNGIFSSVNLGYSWTEITPTIDNLEMKSMYLSSDENLYIVTTQNENYNIKASSENISMIPVPMIPDNNSLNQDLNVTLKWVKFKKEYNSYCLQVSTDPKFNGQLMVDKKWISVEYYNLNNLKSNTKYYWRLSSINSCSQSKWSESNSFTTK